jgi:ERCC4-related helicase
MTTPFEHNNEDVMMSDEDAFHQFFLAPSVSEEELALVAPTIKVNLIEAMERMEASIRNNVNNQEETDRDDENGKDSSCNEQETEADTSAATAAAFIGGNVRRYQNTLLEMAKRQNIIVYLSTGAGKTLIALLLIQHYHQNVNHDNSNNTQHKQTLFLVSSVALALQQTAVLQANLPPHLHVCTASQMTVSKETQRNKLASAQVIVATHGAMLELLQHYGDLFQMQHFSLLILDECHHCTGNSNYATIMNQFYHKLKERPRVLGLTASPLINVKHNLTNEQLDYKLDQLERLVDARIVALSELDLDGIDDEEDGKNQNEAQIVLQKDVTVASVVYSESHACFQPLPSMSDWVLHKSRTKEFQQIHVLYEDLGPWIVRLYSEKLHAITKLKVFDGESKEEFQRALQYLKSAQAHCQREITNDTRAFGRTDKLLRLEKLLEQQVEERPDAVGVVFVKMRLTAVALHYYFQERLKQTLDPVSDSHANIPHVEVPSVTLCRKSYELQLLCHKMMGKDDDSVDSRFADADDDDRDYSYIKDVELDQVWEAVTENEEADDASKYADADNDPFQTVLKGVFPCSTTNKVSSVCVVQVQDNQATAKCGTRTTSKAVPASAVDSIRSDVLVRKESSVLKASYSGRHLTHWQAEMLQTELLEQQWKIQTVLNRLRRGDVNVLFATSVVEEGTC